MGVGPVRPDLIREWCGTGATNVVQPGNSQIDQGWAVGQKPPSSYDNWFKQKTDQYLKYLEWRTSFDKIVDTDFNDFPDPKIQTYDIGPPTTSGYWPLWDKSPTGILAGGGVVTVGDMDGGAVGASYLAYISKPVDPPNLSLDFRLETIAGYYNGATRASLQIGWPTGPIAFVATGQSGFWGLRFKPSGVVATSIGMSFYTASGYKRMTLEARGPTMILLVDGQQLYALPRAMVDESGAQTAFGIYHQRASGVLNTTLGVVDRLSYEIKRPG